MTPERSFWLDLENEHPQPEGQHDGMAMSSRLTLVMFSRKLDLKIS